MSLHTFYILYICFVEKYDILYMGYQCEAVRRMRVRLIGLPAPHGSGRLIKREDVKENYTVSQYKQAMKGIYCSCIGKDTLDEAPFAYRGIEEIAEAIKDTVEIEKRIRPIYNFKAGENRR